MVPAKVCPVVLRWTPRPELLVFRHPTAGIQLVKGTVEPGEKPADVLLRELREESGIRATIVQDWGLWDTGVAGQIWSVQLCAPTVSLPDYWTHRCADDGGLDFEFFWHDLAMPPTVDWHPIFQSILIFIRRQALYARRRVGQ